MGRAEAELRPLRRFLQARGWPQRVTTYDQYGGPRMLVMLEPEPTQEQLDLLHARFGDAYRFSPVSQRFEVGPPDLPS